jgi:DNA-binding GntR family transcriptional regulator
MKAPFFAASLVPTLPLQIAERIGAGIVEERFAPGERLKEVELAASFGVSRATIREALRLLEKRCLVKILPQRGARVTELSRQELEDLFEMRAALLGLASRRVAERGKAEGLREIRANLKALEASAADGSAYGKASAAMVSTITRLSENQQLAEYIAELAQRFGRYARLGLATRQRREQSLASWRRLVRAIAAGDGDLAESTHRNLALNNLAAGIAEIERREQVGQLKRRA